MVVTLEDTKLWIRVEGDYEDSLIESLILTAEGMVEDILRFPLSEFTDGVPEAVKHAIYFCVSKLYEERNDLDAERVNEILRALLSSYRKVDW